ncbi:MAG: class I SAM-dependent methyltransferase [Negativicutes bacterium]|nr:class I SAM-dependent methyltransferase [Negativicutes bacterium]MBP9537415.1 class I SAM-dependent methyltransferase [Negativicutes bacterium]MBP9948726.1 class I SAM-dependent methyltransferase [Negativicutes bacterium]
MQFIITTITKVNTDLIYQAQALAQKLNKKFVTRNNLSLERLKQDNNVDNILIFTKDGLKAHTSQGDLFFHLNMAQLRILNLNRNQKDHMVEAMDLKPKMSVLDCTLGLGTDATVASYIVGENGKVVGLESATLIYLITKYGLANFNHDNIAINHSLRRIESFNLHYLDYLKAQGDNSFDIVYFDPMFRKPIQDSANFKPMRAIANMEQLQSKALVEALRVAKKRVVIKETKDSMEFERLNISQIYGGKYSSVSYGVIDKG